MELLVFLLVVTLPAMVLGAVARAIRNAAQQALPDIAGHIDRWAPGARLRRVHAELAGVNALLRLREEPGSPPVSVSLRMPASKRVTKVGVSIVAPLAVSQPAALDPMAAAKELRMAPPPAPGATLRLTPRGLEWSASLGDLDATAQAIRRVRSLAELLDTAALTGLARVADALELGGEPQQRTGTVGGVRVTLALRPERRVEVELGPRIPSGLWIRPAGDAPGNVPLSNPILSRMVAVDSHYPAQAAARFTDDTTEAVLDVVEGLGGVVQRGRIRVPLPPSPSSEVVRERLDAALRLRQALLG